MPPWQDNWFFAVGLSGVIAAVVPVGLFVLGCWLDRRKPGTVPGRVVGVDLAVFGAPLVAVVHGVVVVSGSVRAKRMWWFLVLVVLE